jgi:hypothetical protein
LTFRAAEALKQCGPVVTLQLLKDAANRHGLSALLAKPSENHHQQAQAQVQLARFPATSNPSLISQQQAAPSSSSLALKAAISHERLLTHHNNHTNHSHPHQQQQQQQHFATLAHPPAAHHHHQQQQQQQHHHHYPQQAQTQPISSHVNAPRAASRTQIGNPSSSYEFVYNAKSVPVHSNPFSQRHNPSESQHRSIQSARSAQILIDDEATEDMLNEHHAHQHQSNPNLFHHSNPIQYSTTNHRNATFDVPRRMFDHEHQLANGFDHERSINDEHDEHRHRYRHNGDHEHDHDHDDDDDDDNRDNENDQPVDDDDDDDDDDLPPTNFSRSASERQSFGDRNLSNGPPLIFREDVPPHPTGFINGHHPMKSHAHNTQSVIGPALAPKPLPKPMISALALIKPTNAVSCQSIVSFVDCRSRRSSRATTRISAIVCRK